MATTTKTNTNTPAAAKAAGPNASTKVGVVESDKRNKTRTVVVRYKTMHAKYGKYVSRKSVLQVHDENNDAKVGDTVEVTPCRPMSKTKRWSLLRVVERSNRVEPIAQ